MNKRKRSVTRANSPAVEATPLPNGANFDFSSNFIDLVGGENVKKMLEVAVGLALKGDSDLLKKFLDKAFDASSRGSSAEMKKMEARMKAAMAKLNTMSEREVKKLVGEYYSSYKAGRMPVATAEEE